LIEKQRRLSLIGTRNFKMEIGIITLFPEMFDALNYGVIGRAIKQDSVKLHRWQLRDFADDKHRTVDDRPYGGGPGMLMKVEPLQKAISEAKAQLSSAKVISVSPQGKPFTQALAKEVSDAKQDLIFIAGRYEGIDERLITNEIDEEWSLGDFVISGGELAIMAMMDAIIRLIPGVLGHEQSAELDSFSAGLLDHPHYTRPDRIADLKVPDVLLSGDHAEIARWRLKESLGRTWLKRPDLLQKLTLTKEQQELLQIFINEYEANKKV
jgi:tRNA (guanine37-N1)-methyltransferase